MLQSTHFEAAQTAESETVPSPASFAEATTALVLKTPVGSTIVRAAVIGNFPPRQCGLATFTRDIYNCLHKALPGADVSVIAMNDPGAAYDYPSEVTHQIAQNDVQPYRDVADNLNASDTQVLFVQHEFGIYGGPAGAYLLELIERVKMPVITTLHTVLETPNDEQKRVMQALIRYSTTLITMAQKGAQILRDVYGVKDEQIMVVPHGAPSRPLQPTDAFKAHLGLEGRKTLTTFGLLSPNKGIETVIKALPAIREACPDVVYLVIGATHPHLVRNEGEKYRESLKDMARDLGVEDNIRFINRFINDNDLIDILQATDVYVTPYLTETQITSGTLSYALAVGRPTVSTPYWHAAEALANGVGIICPFHDAPAFGTAISKLLSDDQARADMSRRAYAAAQPSRWSAVARAYVERAEDDMLTYRDPAILPPAELTQIPSWTAIARMSDDCGILQHGKYRMPDRQHGYCTDDNCRALSLAARQSLLGPLDAQQLALAYRYAAFVNHAWNPEGRFRNFMSYSRQWLDDGGSDDCCARTFESLIDVARSRLPDDLRQWAIELGSEVLTKSSQWTALRARAVMIKNLTRAFGVMGDGQDIQVQVRYLSRHLHHCFLEAAHGDHLWFEDFPTYDNARVPEGLIVGGQFLAEPEMVNDGVRALKWLMQRQTVKASGYFIPVPTSQFDGEDGQDHPIYDQQPLEVLATIDACLTAAKVTGDSGWTAEAMRAFAWFHGKNTQNLSLLDGEGGCFDGLTPGGYNRNQGAESILSYPMSWAAMKSGL